MNFKKKHFTIVAVSVAALLMFSATAFAKKAPLRSNTVRANQAIVTQLKVKTDLMIDNIYAKNCPCSSPLSSLNAMLYNELWVTIGNWPCLGSGATNNVTGQLKVTYFDVSTNSIVNRTMPFSMNKNSRKAIKVHGGPILMRASSGITASIVRIDGRVVDCNPANNTKRLKKCDLPPVY
jgi:hypothetical protein